MPGVGSTFSCCLLVLSLHRSASICVPELTAPLEAGCACPDETLIFTCVTQGGIRTEWRGSAFNCPDTQNQILLRHIRNTSSQTFQCNDGSITGRLLNVSDDCYTSQLNITVTARVNNEIVQCMHTSDTAVPAVPVGSARILQISGPYPPPYNVTLVTIANGKLLFNWDSVNNSCPYFLITADDCGICANSTNSTNITCSTINNMLLTSNAATVCTFRIQSVICGHISNHSDPISVRLKVPDAPKVQIIPRYFSDNRSLAFFRLRVQQVDSFHFTDSISSHVSNYSISFYNSSSNVMSTTSTRPVCDADICHYFFNMSSIICVEDQKLTISAINQLGQGSATMITLGCFNNFVRIEADSSSYTIKCIFLNQIDTEKSCGVIYGLCHQEMNRTIARGPTRNNSITITLETDHINQPLCFIVNATIGILNIEVEGMLHSVPSNSDTSENIIIAVIVSIIILVLVVVFSIIIAVVLVKKKLKGKKDESQTETVDMQQLPPHAKYFESVVRGHHVYKVIWTPRIGEELPTERELDNKWDKYAIAIMKSEDIVGHIPRDISKICTTFIERGGKIECKITKHPQQQKDTMTKDEERLEVPCIYKLSIEDKQNLQDTEENLNRKDRSLVKWVKHW